MKHFKDDVNQLIQQQLKSNILPALFPKYNEILKKCGGAYMVVVGGINVQHCANKNTVSKSMITKLMSEDIDIKFVVLDISFTAKVNKIRKAFTQEVMVELAMPFKNKPDGITFDIDSQWLTSQSQYEHKIEIISIFLSFDLFNKLNGTSLKRTAVLDTSVFSRESSHLFYAFKKALNSKVPIPFEVSNNVRYGTCDYAYLDTFRMLLEKLNMLVIDPSAFSLLKFYRYIIKFMCLFLMRNTVKSLSPKIKKMYIDAYSSLSKLDTLRLETSLTDMLKFKLPINYGNLIGLFSKVLRCTKLNKLAMLLLKHKKALGNIRFTNALDTL